VDVNTRGTLKDLESSSNQIGETFVYVCRSTRLELIVSRILEDSSEEVGTREVIECFLIRRYGSSHNFRIQMVRKDFQQGTLNREWLVKELFVKILLLVMDKDDGDSFRVKLRTPCPSHHLQNVRNRHIHVAVRLSVKVFRSFDYYQVSREIHTPGQGGSGNQDLGTLEFPLMKNPCSPSPFKLASASTYLNFLVDKQFFNNFPIILL